MGEFFRSLQNLHSLGSWSRCHNRYGAKIRIGIGFLKRRAFPTDHCANYFVASDQARCASYLQDGGGQAWLGQFIGIPMGTVFFLISCVVRHRTR